MPGPRCNVKLCANYSGKLNHEGERITFHRFPKNQELRNIWLQKCEKTGNWNVDYGYVCSVHFLKDDFKRDLQAELLGYKGRRKLKPLAVPCLYLPNGNKVINKIPTNLQSLNNGYEKQRHDELIEECLQNKQEKIPLSFERFKKYKMDRNKIASDEFNSSNELISLETGSNKNGKSLNLFFNQKSTEKQDQRDINKQPRRNVLMQKKMMEKIFLASYFEEEYADKAKIALLKVFALAPNSYNRFAKKLNLPCSDVLSSWNNKSLTTE